MLVYEDHTKMLLKSQFIVIKLENKFKKSEKS